MPSHVREFDPHDMDLADDPYPSLTRLRERGSAVQVSSDLWAVTRHRDIVDVLSRTDDFSSSASNLPPSAPDAEAAAIRARGIPLAPALLTADPPAHGRHRRIVQHAFSGRRTAQLTGVVQTIIDELIDSLPRGEHVELRAALAEPLPLGMITNALGLPRTDVHRVHRWSDAVVARIGRPLGPEEQREVARANLELQDYLVAALAERRAKPADDLLSDVARASEEEDDPITMAEMLTILEQVMVAGNETTTRLIVFLARHLADRPTLQDRIRHQPDDLPRLIEETLRIETPVQSKVRVATRDTAVGDTTIPAGTRLLVHLGAGNHDPEVFANPDTLDLDRPNLRDHLAFGYGRHFCIGATLARTEARMAISSLLQAYGHIELSPEHPPPRYERSLVHRGLERLDLRLS